MSQQGGIYPPNAFFGTLLKSNALMFICCKHIPSAENIIALQTPHSVSTEFIFYNSLNAVVLAPSKAWSGPLSC